jgi:hypothetical protein
MTEPMPKWLTRRYAILWKGFKDKSFEFEDAKKLLNEDNDKRLSVILSDFRKYGWLKVELHPESSRKRIYKLKSPTAAFEEIAKETT